MPRTLKSRVVDLQRWVVDPWQPPSRFTAEDLTWDFYFKQPGAKTFQQLVEESFIRSLATGNHENTDEMLWRAITELKEPEAALALYVGTLGTQQLASLLRYLEFYGPRSRQSGKTSLLDSFFPTPTQEQIDDPALPTLEELLYGGRTHARPSEHYGLCAPNDSDLQKELEELLAKQP